ncbi:MAG: hypothetical protein WDM84_08405 [Bauldia sp.]
MVQTILIGIAAGLAAALLFLAPASGSALAFPLFALTGLPLAIATLGWGSVAGVAAAAAGAVVIFGIFPGSVVAPAIFLALFGVPIVWLARLVGLTRPEGDGNAGLQWYPLSRLLLQVTVAAALAVVAVGIVSGYQPEAMVQDATSALVELLTQMQAASLPPTPAEIEPMVRVYVAVMPFMVALLMVALFTFDLWLGSLVARASSRFAGRRAAVERDAPQRSARRLPGHRRPCLHPRPRRRDRRGVCRRLRLRHRAGRPRRPPRGDARHRHPHPAARPRLPAAHLLRPAHRALRAFGRRRDVLPSARPRACQSLNPLVERRPVP